jgi:hypothetical protein
MQIHGHLANDYFRCQKKLGTSLRVSGMDRGSPRAVRGISSRFQ